MTNVCSLPSVAGQVRCRHLRWLGHVACMSHDRQPVQVLSGQLLGPGVKGRPQEDVEVRCAQRPDCFEKLARRYRIVQDRLAWRQLDVCVHTHAGT